MIPVMSTQPPSSSSPPREQLTGIPVEFTVLSEPWVRYKLEDGTRLFVKLVVAKVIRGFDQAGQPAYTFTSQNVMATHVPPSLKGQPSTAPFNLSDPSTFKIAASVDFDRMGPEKWNVYNLADGSVLKTRLEISTIARLDNYGADGDPVYLTNGQPLVRFKVADSLLKQAVVARKPDTKGPYA